MAIVGLGRDGLHGADSLQPPFGGDEDSGVGAGNSDGGGGFLCAVAVVDQLSRLGLSSVYAPSAQPPPGLYVVLERWRLGHGLQDQQAGCAPRAGLFSAGSTHARQAEAGPPSRSVPGITPGGGAGLGTLYHSRPLSIKASP